MILRYVMLAALVPAVLLLAWLAYLFPTWHLPLLIAAIAVALGLTFTQPGRQP